MFAFPAKAFCMILLSAGMGLGAAEEKNSWTILETQEVDLGNHSIIYQRVAPPPLQPFSSGEGALPSTAPLQGKAPLAPKRHFPLVLWTTVYNGQVSEARFWQKGQEYVVWSDINFKYFQALPQFESEEATYTLLVIVSEESQSTVPPSGLLAQQPLAETSSHFVVQASEGAVSPEFLQAMVELHRYYDTHRQELIQADQESEALAQESPSPPGEKTIIHYFPIHSAHVRK